MKNIFIYGSALLFFLGCVEPFDLELDKVKARLVVQGLIENNAGPHYIRLTKSNPGLNIEDHGPIVVEDATVIITDDFGQTETLDLIPKKDELDPYDTFGGFYKTSNFIGVEGRTYSIKITTIELDICIINGDMPILAIPIKISFFNFKFFNFNFILLFPFKKCLTWSIATNTFEITVAIAAPFIPIPNVNIKNGSNKIFNPHPIILIFIATFGLPSPLIILFIPINNSWKVVAKNIIDI